MALLTVTELREVITSTLTDDRLQEILDATEQDIIAAAGATDEQTEHALGGHATIVLARPIGSIATVTEKADTDSELDLETDDYRVDGHILHRLLTGTNPRYTWNGLVRVVHDPADRLAERKRAQTALVSLDLTQSQSGYQTEETLDERRSKFPNASTVEDRRQQILDSLRPVLVA